MKPKDVVSFAGRNITQKKTQSLLTIIGIVIGILAIVSLISLGYGVQNYITEEISKAGASVITVYPSQQITSIAMSKNFNDQDLKAVEGVRGVDVVLYGWFGGTQVTYHDQEYYSSVFATKSSTYQIFFTEAYGYELEKGRWMKDSDKYTCVIGYSLAHDTFDREIDIGDKIEINDKKYKVVGILEQIGNPDDDNSIVIPYEAASEVFDVDDEYNMFMVKIKDGEDVTKVSEDIEDELEDSRGDENFSVLTAEQLAESISSIFSVLTIFLVGVAGISLLVGAVGISNTMHMSILERRKDIGILKALGAENNTILSIFVVEAGFLGLFGGIIGTILGILIAKAIEYIAAISGYGLIRAWISWELIVGVLVFSFVVGILSGYFPARSGAKLNPVDTLRGE
ncbi:putative ABC transport system permease protein [Methanococcus maripaludis]|uniref:Putative ABC transport system permease protein n=2 Tax=Methanococcus maripaludis TaxID=39152 RepID=A0A2L1C8Y9_METMI|nr:ABC transporter permease [Methanococcus maripaludis]AVB75763.1 putative ABC transporter permease YknZ [Methanococcus maripaludis]MBA2841160.1 putative ABC transport system permease protein [Methanococcus maripaludis]MBA2860644.1 putative ABC transport system permease protein [Methanococcus maripaludis]MBA2864179.1 putative ABC transport system permease protein [Methanococcus maripaludis]MBA2869571.1 putative ABC transport system permease protein [Methanococcus maripaludis]